MEIKTVVYFSKESLTIVYAKFSNHNARMSPPGQNQVELVQQCRWSWAKCKTLLMEIPQNEWSHRSLKDQGQEVELSHTWFCFPNSVVTQRVQSLLSISAAPSQMPSNNGAFPTGGSAWPGVLIGPELLPLRLGVVATWCLISIYQISCR